MSFVGSPTMCGRSLCMDHGDTARSGVVRSLHWRGQPDVARAYVATSLCLALVGCVTSNATPTAGVAPSDAMDSVRNADFSPRYTLDERSSFRSRESSQPLLFPGSDVEPEPQREGDPQMRTASLQQAA